MKINSTPLTLTTILGCQNGNRESQKQLYKLYSSKLYPVCLNNSSSQQEAEEKLVHLFISVYNRIHLFDFTTCFESWAITLMPALSSQLVYDHTSKVAVSV